MTTYAVFQTGGKQYKVSQGDTVRVESLNIPASGKISINDVLLHSENGSLTIGSPTIEGASISAKLVKNGMSKKIRVFHYKHKTRLRKTFGHRQNFTELEITDISLKAPKKTTAKKSTPALHKPKTQSCYFRGPKLFQLFPGSHRRSYRKKL